MATRSAQPGVHAADIGRLINPMQCRGQIDGAIAMGFGWALYEKMVYDGNGAMVNPALRAYRIPSFADVRAQRDLSQSCCGVVLSSRTAAEIGRRVLTCNWNGGRRPAKVLKSTYHRRTGVSGGSFDSSTTPCRVASSAVVSDGAR